MGSSHKKPYDPLQFTEKVESGALKEAHHKLKLLEFDYKALHDKRLQDVSCWLKRKKTLLSLFLTTSGINFRS